MDFCLCGKTSLCAKPFVWRRMSLVLSFSWKIRSFSCEMFCTSIRSKKRPRQKATPKWKLSLRMRQVVHQVGTYSGFCSITRSISTTPPPTRPTMGWYSIAGLHVPHSIKFPSTYLSPWMERGSESKVSCSRTQYNVASQGSRPDCTK